MPTDSFVRHCEAWVAAAETAYHRSHIVPLYDRTDEDECFYARKLAESQRMAALNTQFEAVNLLRLVRGLRDSANAPAGTVFYVTARNDDGRWARLAGSFASHGDALRALPEATRAAIEANPTLAFCAFGTAAVSGK